MCIGGREGAGNGRGWNGSYRGRVREMPGGGKGKVRERKRTVGVSSGNGGMVRERKDPGMVRDGTGWHGSFRGMVRELSGIGTGRVRRSTRIISVWTAYREKK